LYTALAYTALERCHAGRPLDAELTGARRHPPICIHYMDMHAWMVGAVRTVRSGLRQWEYIRRVLDEGVSVRFVC
jgi:hypothetical protein